MALAAQGTLQDPRQVEPSERLRDLAAPRNTIFPQTLLQEGTFGRIYRGVYQDEDKGRQVEGNINNGVVLSRFLQNCRSRGEEQYTLLTQDIVDMGIQVVLAMMYLHGQRICHRDLAARNCVVDEKLRVKVADNALARDLFPADYHCLGDNENRPIKWLAVESLLHKHFSGASDVWSFGVLLWELTTLAQQPYAEVDPFEMGAYLRDGYRLAQPVNCPDELRISLAECVCPRCVKSPPPPPLAPERVGARAASVA
ncbi:cAMP-dependent protein kinase catalytic subunit 1 [Gryllus bimaculatus]|nr:cAMP-dependent protein kinase catalytic subunit 1 [Gryllus bimaculatus]